MTSAAQSWPIIAIAAAVLLAGVLVVLLRRRRGSRLDQVLNEISFDRIETLVVPNGDEGEILIDHLLLTSKGLLILEIKKVEGTVFGGDKLNDWSVIAETGRHTFSNPQPGLYDRVAAVRSIVRGVPVEGRILFDDGAEFPKGTPDLVSSLDRLIEDFGEQDKNAVRNKIEAFKPHWDAILKYAT